MNKSTLENQPLQRPDVPASKLARTGRFVPASIAGSAGLTLWLRRAGDFIYDFLIGATLSWVLAPFQIRKRREMEQIISLLFSAQMMGMPLLPPSARLRLLPYLLPSLMYWRRMTVFDRAIEGADLRHLGH